MVDVISLIKLKAKLPNKYKPSKERKEAGPLTLISGNVENK